MARPRGYRLNRAALDDILEAKRLTMTAAAELCGMPLTTLSGLAAPKGHRASITTVGKLANGIGCKAETLFPELAKFADVSQADAEVAA